MLVSACSRPFIVDVSPSGRIATVKVAQPSPQTLVLDGESGRVVLTMERPRGVLALSDVLLYYTVGEQDHKIYDLALHQEFPIVKLPSQSTDLSVIEDARDEARGNYEYYEGSMQLFVFNLQSSRRAIDISEITYETYLELSDSWDLKTRVVMANTARPDNSPFVEDLGLVSLDGSIPIWPVRHGSSSSPMCAGSSTRIRILLDP